ncbi:MAG: diguanylate cyclase [Anaerolineales bacterium]|nr:diguanylate cyclase [Anaerolineales bacterium]
MPAKKAPTPRAAKEPTLAQLRKENTELKKKLDKVSLERNFFERAMADLNFHNNAHDGVVYTNSSNQITYANPYFLTMMGVDAKTEILEKEFPAYMWQQEQDAQRLFEDIKTNGFVRERELTLYNKLGQPVFAVCSAVTSKDDEGNIIGTELMFCNVTSKRKFQAELMEQIALFDAVLHSTPDPILLLTTDLKLTRANQAASDFFDIHLGKDTEPKLAALLQRAGLAASEIERITGLFANPEGFDFEVALGDQHFDWHAAPLQLEHKGWVCVLHNITVRKLTQEVLQHHATHDPLTQVPNRAYFIDHLSRANLLAQQEANYRYAVLFIDLDDLKVFNDSFGHMAGDELLNKFARRIEASIRPGDIVARLGGDEFAVFLNGVEQQQDAMQVANRVHQDVLRPFELSNLADAAHITASIGIALSDKDRDAEGLLREADQAMYEVKQEGGNNVRLFGAPADS